MGQIQIEPFDPAAVDVAHAHGIVGSVAADGVSVEPRLDAAVFERVIELVSLGDGDAVVADILQVWLMPAKALNADVLDVFSPPLGTNLE